MKKKLLAMILSFIMIISSVNIVSTNTYADEKVLTSGDYKYINIDSKSVRIISYLGNSEIMIIPSTINGKKVTQLGSSDDAFGVGGESGLKDPTGNNVKRVVIPNTVKGIYGSFINFPKLETVDIPDSVTQIDEGSFYKCTSLKTLKLPSKLEYLGESSFSFCTSLETVEFPNEIGVRWAKKGFIIGGGESAFLGCTNLKTVTGGAMLAEDMFLNCEKLESITLCSATQEITSGSFIGCKSLKSITVPKSTQFIDQDAFDNIEDIKLNIKGKNLHQVYKGGNYVLKAKVKIKGTYEYKKAYSIFKAINKQMKSSKMKKRKLDKQTSDFSMKRSIDMYMDSYYGIDVLLIDKYYDEPKIVYYSRSVFMFKKMTSKNIKKVVKDFTSSIKQSKYPCTAIGIGCVKLNGYYNVCIYTKKTSASNSKKVKKTGSKKFNSYFDIDGQQIVKLTPNKTTVNVTKGKKVKLGNVKYKLHNVSNNVRYSKAFIKNRAKHPLQLSNLKFTSANKKIAKVNSKGVIKGIKKGKTKIKIAYKANPTVKCTVKVTIR